MKKVLSFVAFAMMVISSLSLVSCSKDDDIDGENGNIVGTWKCDLAVDYGKDDDLYGIEEYHSYIYSQYKEDGTFTHVHVYITKYTKEAKQLGLKDETEVEIEKGTYRTNGNKLTETINGESTSGEYKIEGNKLILTNTSGLIMGITFSRVSDSEINQYLK